MEYIRTLRDLMQYAEARPILGMEKYKLGQGLNEKQACEIKQLVACSVGLDFNDIQPGFELSSGGSPYWWFVIMYLMVIGAWGVLNDDYYDKQRKKLWNALNILEKAMAYTYMEVSLNLNLDEFEWTH